MSSVNIVENNEGENETLTGTDGTDRFEINGCRSDFEVTRNGNTVTIRNTVTGEVDTLINFEEIQFENETICISDLPDSGSSTNIVNNESGTDETLTGTAGTDRFVIDGDRDHYTIINNDGEVNVINIKTGERDILTNFEEIKFNDEIVQISAITEVDINLVIDDGGENETLTGTDGTDRFLILGDREDYTITREGDVVTIKGPDGETDVLTDFEEIQFGDDDPIEISTLGNTEVNEVENKEGEDEEVEGTDGTDRFVIDGDRDHYTIINNDGNVNVINIKTGERDILTDFEEIKFNDETIQISSITEVDINLVIDDSGESETLTGTDGTDRFLILGDRDDYTLTREGNVLTIEGPDGETDVLTNFEEIQFNDADPIEISDIDDSTVNEVENKDGEDEELEGTDGTDRFVIDGDRSDYVIINNDGEVNIINIETGERDILTDFEEIQFNDETKQISDLEQVDINLVIDDSDENEMLSGTDDTDRFLVLGDQDDYTLTRTGDELTIEGPEGEIDIITGFEQIQFNDNDPITISEIAETAVNIVTNESGTDETLTGEDGIDRFVLEGDRTNYLIINNDGEVNVINTETGERDILTDFEQIQFNDERVSIEDLEQIDVNLVLNDSGTNESLEGTLETDRFVILGNENDYTISRNGNEVTIEGPDGEVDTLDGFEQIQIGDTLINTADLVDEEDVNEVTDTADTNDEETGTAGADRFIIDANANARSITISNGTTVTISDPDSDEVDVLTDFEQIQFNDRRILIENFDGADEVTIEREGVSETLDFSDAAEGTINRVAYFGDMEQYEITRDGDVVTIVDTESSTTDTITGANEIQFADQVIETTDIESPSDDDNEVQDDATAQEESGSDGVTDRFVVAADSDDRRVIVGRDGETTITDVSSDPVVVDTLTNFDEIEFADQTITLADYDNADFTLLDREDVAQTFDLSDLEGTTRFAVFGERSAYTLSRDGDAITITNIASDISDVITGADSIQFSDQVIDADNIEGSSPSDDNEVNDDASSSQELTGSDDEVDIFIIDADASDRTVQISQEGVATIENSSSDSAPTTDTLTNFDQIKFNDRTIDISDFDDAATTFLDKEGEVDTIITSDEVRYAYFNDRSEYTLTREGDVVQVVTPNGETDVLTGVDELQFADEVVQVSDLEDTASSSSSDSTAATSSSANSLEGFDLGFIMEATRFNDMSFMDDPVG